ncbi:hypothetical protein [Tsukamurella spumae]|uniref:Uncharacterized protein n=1 Tax=Tsukamurella spumae TaxID=44753 RepID=A0A846WXI2_9ACTN|nr:hypothetical protein [Tsukamurella spumae]NKY17594.1 hypothetical protein [Tsukamurella spumae]
MSDDQDTVVPLYTLATDDVGPLPVSADVDGITPERLRELRSALAVLADAPIATLEVHHAPEGVDRSRGIPLDVASPLAQQLALLVAGASRVAKGGSGEVLYRMVVPAKVAGRLGAGVVPMASKSVAGGIHSAMVGKSGIAAHASFVPVAGKTGLAGGVAGAAGAGAAMTIAAPLVLMAVAAGLSAHAEQQRREQMEKIAALLEKADRARLESERNQLDGCRSAIDKATAVLLDEGRIGASLGLDSAAHAIDTAVATADRRLGTWEKALADLPEGKVELGQLRNLLPGVDDEAGEFQIQLELAGLALALKRRVILLQAVEHAQLEEGNLFENFTRTLRLDQKNVERVESGLYRVLSTLSQVRLDRSHGIRDIVFRAGQVDELLEAGERLRALGNRVADPAGAHRDVAIDIVGATDGSVVVLPAVAS